MGRNNSMQKPSIVARLKSDQAVAVGFISPALVVLSCVIAIPILRGIWTSFCDCSLRNLMSPTWAGLKNYIALFKKGEFFACAISVTCSIKYSQMRLRSSSSGASG